MTADLAFFWDEWKFDRSLSLDLLASLTDDELHFVPHAHLGPLWKQFRHLGRVQENYIQALSTGKMEFSARKAHYQGGCSPNDLIDYLSQLDCELSEQVTSWKPAQKIDWFGEPVELFVHLMRLANHEVLHHGELIVYLRLMGKVFPKSWSAWGV